MTVHFVSRNRDGADLHVECEIGPGERVRIRRMADYRGSAVTFNDFPDCARAALRDRIANEAREHWRNRIEQEKL